MDRQSRIALLLISVLALYLVHTWHVKSASDDVSSLSTPSPVVHPPSILDPTQESSYAAAAPAPTEYVDAEANRWAAADEHMLENDMVKNEYVDYSTKPTIAKVSMLYGANPKPAYVRALRSHRIHNERFNYGMFVLTEDAVGGFWNKPIYLLSLIMQELSKPPAERLQWLMWVDADLILINPSIPLESFLPPVDLADSIHFIGGRDQNGLNTGTFFLKVSAWSVHMLNKALGMPIYRPEIDLGNSFDQVAMSRVLSEDYGFGEVIQDAQHAAETPSDRAKRLAKFTRPFLFQPREWYNTYQFTHGYEGGDAQKGHLLVHFPGLEEQRWQHMDNWLNELARNQPTWDVPFDKSVYADLIPLYWQLVRESRRLVQTANETLADLDPYLEQYARLREATDLCESPLTNTSYVLGPGEDLLARMQQGIQSLSAVVKDTSTADDPSLQQPPRADTAMQANPTNNDWDPLSASVQCTCSGECTEEQMRKITSNPLCESWL